MKQINLFPVEFFEFRNNSIDNSAIVSFLKKEPFQEHTALSSLENIHLKSQYKNLFDWIDECLEEVRVAKKYDCEKISLTSSWCNKYPAGESAYHSPHKHSMSWFSGIYYVTDGAPTLFDDPVVHRTSAQIEVIRKDFFPLELINAEAGKLILFPSWVPHSTAAHREDFDRWTVAFNTFPSGKINYNIARDSIAILNVGGEI